MILRASLCARLRVGSSTLTRSLASTATTSPSPRLHGSPNAPLDLDPSYQALFNDIDIALTKSKVHPESAHRELEVVNEKAAFTSLELSSEDWSPFDDSVESVFEEHEDEREHRKSPAAQFGSDQISMVVLPSELQMSIQMLISEHDKSTLRSDSLRLFRSKDEGEGHDIWNTQYDTAYSSRKQASRHSIRDGTAFATIALPAHYSAISAVFHHLKRRLDPGFVVNRVIDWGAGTGSGLWASLYSFQNKTVEPDEPDEEARDRTVLSSSIKSYIGIDKREGLVSIGQKLLSNVSQGGLTVKWKKSYRPEDRTLREEGPNTIALSAFMLTAQPHSLAQKTLVQEMWDSGAHTIVLIDHSTKEGFEAIAHAREFILGLGKAEVDDPATALSDLHGAHVLAPCPHDRACPLLHSGGAPLVCGFQQRIQRPSFVRQTKHSGVGHEDVGYSYVIIRRGPRPPLSNTSVGRVGGIGKKEQQSKPVLAPMRELTVMTTKASDIPEAPMEETENVDTSLEDISLQNSTDLQAQLRQEAYQWPRLIFRPLKKSGHIILDSCTVEGKIMRLTIPKSQGKQPFYDARKSNWGDIFPHAPKNPPLVRYQPKTHRKGQPPSTGGDIGKRKDSFKERERPSYETVAEYVQEKKKRSRRDFARTRGDKVWSD